MNKKYLKIIKDPKIVLIVVLVLIVIFILFSTFFLTSGINFEIEDKCGTFVNLVSHTIPDKETCQSRCRSQCISKDLTYKKVDFNLMPTSCHECKCHCK